MDEEDTKRLSDYNEAANQIFRLDNLYQLAGKYSRDGELIKWKWVLENIWRELATDAFESNEYRYKIEIIKHNTEILKARNDKSKLYHALNNKEIWLRCLQDEVGKGSKKSSRYEDLM